jgi:hypothetical protein
MTRRERTVAEIGVAFDLLRFAVDHPQVLRKIPNGATVAVVSGDRPVPRTRDDDSVVTFVARRTFQRVA